MIEDKLTHAERLRLECVAQSVALNAMQRASAEKVLDDAGAIERFIKSEG